MTYTTLDHLDCALTGLGNVRHNKMIIKCIDCALINLGNERYDQPIIVNTVIDIIIKTMNKIQSEECDTRRFIGLRCLIRLCNTVINHGEVTNDKYFPSELATILSDLVKVAEDITEEIERCEPIYFMSFTHIIHNMKQFITELN